MHELSLHILDVLENSIEAGATRIELAIEEDLIADRLHIIIQDNGYGMNEGRLTRIFDPFFTTRKTRRIGLGLSLFKAAAERCSGDVTVTSREGKGTMVQATFQHSHIDRAPLGDIVGTLLAVILSGPSDVHYIHRVGEQAFEFDTADIRAELEEIPLTHPEVRKWLQAFIAAGEEKIRQSPLPAAGGGKDRTVGE